MPRSKVDPGRPSECLPKRILFIGFWAVKTIAICIRTVFTVTPNYGAASSFGMCGLPCGLCRSLCTLQLSCSAFASVTTATLGMNGWRGLIQRVFHPVRSAKLRWRINELAQRQRWDWRDSFATRTMAAKSRPYPPSEARSGAAVVMPPLYEQVEHTLNQISWVFVRVRQSIVNKR